MNHKHKLKKSIRVLISLPEKFLDEVDRFAEEEQRTRSELIREALRLYIKGSGMESEEKLYAV
jgi:CopG family transcriptional regulator / antitoxin EndoAI